MISRRERELELLWRQTGGVDPHTGKAWLTPRMLRDAQELERKLRESVSGR